MFQNKAKKIMLAIASVWLSVVALFFSFQNFEVERPNSEVSQSSKSMPPNVGHIRYFGYYGAAMGGLEDVTQVTSDHANLTWIAYGGPDYVVSKLKEAQSLNMYAVIDLQSTFFDAHGNLLPNYQQSWETMAEAIEPYLGTIAAFYPMDEPYGNARDQGVSIKTRLSQLNTIAATLRSRFAGIPIAAIMDINSIKKGDPLPNFDWFGMDCYHKFKNCGGYSIPSYFFGLISKMHYGQHLIVVPWAFSAPDFPNDENGLLDQAKDYYNFALSFPSVIAVTPFIYQTFVGTDGIKMTGVESMPRLRQAYVYIGHQIDPIKAMTTIPPISSGSNNNQQPPNNNSNSSTNPAVQRADRVDREEAHCGRSANGRMIECR